VGFPSSDSDFDVRFYMLSTRLVFSYRQRRDVVERPIDAQAIDLSGWDLKRRWTAAEIKPSASRMASVSDSLSRDLFNCSPTSWTDTICVFPLACMHHYLHMAEGISRLPRSEVVRVRNTFTSSGCSCLSLD